MKVKLILFKTTQVNYLHAKPIA